MMARHNPKNLNLPWPWWLLPVMLVLLGMVLAPPVRAQSMGHTDLVSAYIERTDELIEWAAELVAETESGTARSVLRQAKDMNRRASDNVEQGRPDRGANMARRARAAVWHAVKLAREAMGLQERLRVRAERFIELHRHLSERARDLGHEGALDLLRKAEGQSHRAREQYLQGDLRLAWQMFERAEDLTSMAARLMAETGDPAQLEQELERVQDQLDRAHERLGDDLSDQARRSLGEAEEALDRARNHLSAGEPGRAMQMIGLARRLADRALDRRGGSGGTREAVERQLERFDSRLVMVQERTVEQDNEQARNLVNQARGHRDRAESALARDAMEEALRQIRAAHNLLEQAERTLR